MERDKTFKVIIAGSRVFNDWDLLYKKCLYYLKDKQDVEIVSGGCRGADKLGERFAREMGYKLTVFPADWDQHGRSAGPIRNTQMAKYADALIAFLIPKKQMSGTEDMIDNARHYGLQVRVIES